MRILIVCESYLSIGGVAEVVDSLAGAFIRMNHQVAVVSHPFEFAAGGRATRAAVEHFAIRIPRVQPVTWRHPERLFRRRRSGELLSLLRQWRPNVANFHEPLWERIPAAFEACRAAGVPVVLTLHDLVNENTPAKSAARAINWANSVSFVSSATKSSFVPIAGPAQGGVVIINGVDCDAAAHAAALVRPRPYLLCAARINLRHKAMDVLVEAFGLIANDYPELDLLITGDGTDRDALVRMVESLGLGRRIALIGVRSREELWSLYKGATLFAMPSHKPEGLGLAFLEAMACGRAVIGTNSGGTPEIVGHGDTGLLMERNEPGEVAAALRRLLENPEERQRMGRRGHEVAIRQDWLAVARRYLEVYRGVPTRGCG
jgi:glycosyltransferase involved in cell wall biosynthesis